MRQGILIYPWMSLHKKSRFESGLFINIPPAAGQLQLTVTIQLVILWLAKILSWVSMFIDLF